MTPPPPRWSGWELIGQALTYLLLVGGLSLLGVLLLTPAG